MTHGPLNGTMADFTFDARGRLTIAGDTSYTYDAEGNRIAVTEGGSQTSYVIDPNAALSRVLIKTDASVNNTYYIYGLGLIGQEENGAYLTYHYDLRGSTVALTDINGAVTDRFQYSAYGELVHRTGSTSTPFMFNGLDGVMTDTNGLLYMRARYYNPELRRFLSKDPLMGSITEPQSLDAYGYCENDPVNRIDPSGELSWDEFNNYMSASGRQIIKGNYTEDVTVLGTAGQIGVGAIGLDLPCDIRDISYDVAHWEWSWKHGLQTGGDVVALLPVVGTLKYTDEGVTLLRSGERISTKGSKRLGAAGERVFNVTKQESKIWRGFKNIKGTSIKTSGQGKNKRYYVWDHTHNDIEVYNYRGKHVGSMDPVTGQLYKGPIEGRTIKIN